jgi:hypothetical protein
MSDAREYFIKKRGFYYRPNNCGYTDRPILAGLYTLRDAIATTHPNGEDGPRDGMTYLHESQCGDDDYVQFKALKNRADIAEARTAELEARPVKVKPLEWRDSYGVLRADTEFGSYLISASGKILTLGVAPMSPQMVCANLDDAKAAAQADYERRIKDALETPDDQ